MASVIFNGTGVKTLKDELRLSTGAYIISRATDPTSVAVSAPIGSLLIHPSTGEIYKKLDSGSSTNWVRLGTPGGHNQIAWDEIANSPLQTVDNNMLIHSFESGLAQELYTTLVVPAWYSAGRPISLGILAYSAATANNWLMRAQATLIRSEVDAVTSTTNQRTTTNSAISGSAGIANETQKISLDITSTTGQINSVSVSPLDVIVVRLYRDTDTASEDVNLIAKSGRITWS